MQFLLGFLKYVNYILIKSFCSKSIWMPSISNSQVTALKNLFGHYNFLLGNRPSFYLPISIAVLRKLTYVRIIKLLRLPLTLKSDDQKSDVGGMQIFSNEN